MAQKSSDIVTRIAPSPTGHLHIGTARSALFNYLYAKQHGGTFILRSEDTDRARSTEAYESEIKEGLAWLGIIPDAYYRQSEREDVYKKYLEQLIADDAAYISREPSKENPEREVEIVRLRNPNKVVTFTDQIRGEVQFDTTELGDFVIARSLESALYHLAVVVDDYEMNVTHVIRGEDHISNTPRQILIAEAIGAPRPAYAHLPLILGPDRSKMSKRHGAVAINTYREEGLLAEAIDNYLALLGWSPRDDREMFTLTELVEHFDLSRVQKGGAVFDREKLLWINKEHLNTFDEESYLTYIDPFIPKRVKILPQYDAARVRRLLPTLRERAHTGGEVCEEMEAGEYDFAFSQPTINHKLIRWKKDTSSIDALPRLEHARMLLETLNEESDVAAIKSVLFPYAEEIGKGEVLWPLRVALTGKERSPDPFTVTYIIGIREARTRIETACATIKNA